VSCTGGDFAAAIERQHTAWTGWRSRWCRQVAAAASAAAAERPGAETTHAETIHHRQRARVRALCAVDAAAVLRVVLMVLGKVLEVPHRENCACAA
jgi:hypothetical protein